MHRSAARGGPPPPRGARARANELKAYPHDGFWQCMDTLRDKLLLDSMWATGTAPWKKWS